MVVWVILGQSQKAKFLTLTASFNMNPSHCRNLGEYAVEVSGLVLCRMVFFMRNVGIQLLTQHTEPPLPHVFCRARSRSRSWNGTASVTSNNY